MDSKGFTREDYLLLAKMAQQTERHQEMLEFIQKFLRFDAELTAEERSIVSATYKNVVGNKRAELRVLTAIKQREDRKNNEVHINYIKNYEKQIEGELRQLCNEILMTLEKNLIPNCKAMDSKVFYFKMIGKFYQL
jgi:14-3-3 protein epsilon